MQIEKLKDKIQKLKERYGDDRMELQQKIMELYQSEKVSPLSGCAPMILQIPIFFALYKVLFVTIEMRHAPFFGWIQDLSQPDPTSLFNLFGLIPWGRVSSAYGYSQAKTPTWADYMRETDNSGADRDDFEDAIDFMGWFIYKSQKVNGISKWDAYAQYLNYHEGWGGYKRRSYDRKPWLKKVASKVKARSLRYATQLKTCEEDLQKGWFMKLFS